MSLDKAAKDSFRNILDVLLGGAIGALVIVSIFFFIFKFTPYKLVNVHGPSMEPTFSNGDLIVLKETDQIERDHIAVFDLPEEWANSVAESTSSKLIKRVTAVYGDVLTFRGNRVTIKSVTGNTYELVEPKIVNCQLPIGSTLEVPKGTYFATGDNRVQSFDSMEAWCNGLHPFIAKESITINGALAKRFQGLPF